MRSGGDARVIGSHSPKCVLNSRPKLAPKSVGMVRICLLFAHFCVLNSRVVLN